MTRITQNYKAIALPGKQRFADELAAKANWIDIKPNVFGIGLNVNAILQDSVNVFRRKVKEH